MEKFMELLDAMTKSQKEFLESWVSAQKELMANWIETTKKFQETFLNVGGVQEGATKEAINLYKSWFDTMANSSRVFTEEVGRVQETWKSTIGKQMEMNREVMRNFSELFKKAA